jgi:hypothetical protein
VQRASRSRATQSRIVAATQKEMTMNCPIATRDMALNLRNRHRAIVTALYGPANPRLANDNFWRRIASEWGVRPQEARTMRCGNCAAFDVSPEMLSCIRGGLEEDGVEADDVIVLGELGYCHAFKFKCAASRTCLAWIVGGPIRHAVEGSP